MADHSGDEDVETPEQFSSVRKSLEDRAKNAEEKAAQLERELAFNKAGLDGLSDRQAMALFRVHEGDMTAEALKATAEELGFGPQAPPATAPLDEHADITPAQDSRLEQMTKLASSPSVEGPSGQGTTVDLSEFTDNDAMFEFLRGNIPENFGPSQR